MPHIFFKLSLISSALLSRLFTCGTKLDIGMLLLFVLTELAKSTISYAISKDKPADFHVVTLTL